MQAKTSNDRVKAYRARCKAMGKVDSSQLNKAINSKVARAVAKYGAGVRGL